MKNKLGIMLICLSIIIGFSSVVNVFPNIITIFLILGLFSVPLYLFGHLLRTNRYLMKNNWVRWMSAYLFIIIIIPSLFYSMVNYERLKQLYFNSEQYILFESASELHLKGLSIGFVMILLIFISARLFSDDIKRKWLVNLIIFLMLLGYAGYQYMMWEDFRGVHETEGLVKQKWNGVNYSIHWSELDQITITPFIHYAKLTNTSDDTHISWKMTFKSKNGASIDYLFSGLFVESVQSGIQIKEIAAANHIPFIVLTMSEKEREWYELELELNKLQRESFDLFFEVD